MLSQLSYDPISCGSLEPTSLVYINIVSIVNNFFYFFIIFFNFSRSSISGCDNAQSKFAINISRFAGCSGFSFIFTYRSRTDCGIFPWHIYSPITALLESMDCLTCPRIFSKYTSLPPNPAVPNRKIFLFFSFANNSNVSA